MPLYVIRPPNPPLGTDWQATVPGQYLYDITGVTATLTTGGTGGPTVMHDSSGNGNDGIYELFGSPSPLGPGLLPGSNAATWEWNSAPSDRFAEIDSGIDLGDTFSFDVWVNVDPAASFAIPFAFEFSGVLTTCDFYIAADGSIAFRWADTTPYESFTAPGVYPFAGGGTHHVGMSYDGVHAKLYLDGAAVPTTETGTAHLNAGSFCIVGLVYGANTGNTGLPSRYGQPAFYQSALSAGAFAAHHAANSDLAAYSAAVLADSPTNYYELNDTVAGIGRQVTFAVTDGSHDVERIPTGFAEATIAGPFSYSWQPKLASSSQTQAGASTTVAIPRLILPAGYTVGPVTLDLGANDQWSDIAIWWDSTAMDVLNNPYEYPPGWHITFPDDPILPIPPGIK